MKCGWMLGSTPARTVDDALTALEAEKPQKRQERWTEVTMSILDKSRRACRVELQALLKKKKRHEKNSSRKSRSLRVVGTE